jgi:hypothetical protein
MAKEDKWCWSSLANDPLNGPFPTREEAVEDIKAHYYDLKSVEVLLGKVHYCKPGEHVAWVLDDIDNLLERVEESLGIYWEVAFDDNQFEFVGDKEEAEKELRAFGAAWGEKWLSTSAWWMCEEEEVEIVIALEENVTNAE